MKKFEKSSMVVTITHGVPDYGIINGDDLITELCIAQYGYDFVLTIQLTATERMAHLC